MYALSFTKVSFMNVGALAFGAKVFRIERILKLIFSFDEYEVSFLIFFDNFWLKVDFYMLLEWLLQLVSWDHLLGKLFSSPLL